MECLEAETTREDEQQTGAGAPSQRRCAAFLSVPNDTTAHQQQPVWDREAEIMHF
ncbi:UNVERIFIED_CONTAM: hypothetical protein Slati_4006100 [Sesamum latifolium]|uniref:Uncharacterized protein n=1 Tax=Sesamum latifolium TaxID=2727402 RepID=A0AAW2TQJ7_9LAMI